MLAARTSDTHLRSWLQFGGAEVLDSYGVRKDAYWEFQIPESHWIFLETGRPYYESGKYIFVHAGLMPGIPLAQQPLNTLFWEKYQTPEEYEPGRVVISGHTSRKNGEVAHFGHSTCIDTYAYGGQWLTCLNVETGAYLQANDWGMIQRKELYTG